MGRRTLTLMILVFIVGAGAFLVAIGPRTPPGRTLPHAPLPAPSGLSAGNETLVHGRAMRASEDQIVVRTSDGSVRRLAMDHDTDVLLDGEKALRDELREGDEVRAVYQGTSREPTLIRVEANSPAHGERPAPGRPGATGSE